MSILAANHDSSKSKLIPICSPLFDSFEIKKGFLFSFFFLSFPRHRAISSTEMAERLVSAEDDEAKTGVETIHF